MQNSSSANLDISIASSGVATLTFSHPPTNAMPIVLLEDLANAIEKLAEDSKVQIIILQSGGERTFVREQILISYSPLIIWKMVKYFLAVLLK
jgi:methylglutaconyl-CoA hydratase